MGSKSSSPAVNSSSSSDRLTNPQSLAFTYEAAVQKNRQLAEARDQLERFNENARIQGQRTDRRA